MNYATALRAPGQQPSGAAPPSLARSSARVSEDLGAGPAFDHEDMVQLLDERGVEVLNLLGEPWADCAVADLVSWRLSFTKDGRIIREELNRLFMVRERQQR